MRGAYEITGLLESQYGPYEAITSRPGMGGWWDELWEDKPTAEPVPDQHAQPGIGEAVARTTCLAGGGTWDDAQKACVKQAGGPVVDPLANLCANVGLVWDPVKKVCLPVGSTPTPEPKPEEDKGMGVVGYVAIGALALGGIYLLTRKKRAMPNATRRTMSVRDAMREREKAKKFWQGLSRSERGEIGDQLVRGDFDWRDWFVSKPSSALLNEVDQLRMLWESES